MEVPKIQFSSSEAELMMNPEIILTKNRVLQKIRNLLEKVQQRQQNFMEYRGLEKLDIFGVPPKISRGENYLGLPWLILDYPRKSSGNDLFFIRTMFWWGHFFSITLHLSGKYKEHFMNALLSCYSSLDNYFIGVNQDPWVHHFEPSNYKPIATLKENEFETICSEVSDVKIARQFPLTFWPEADSALFEEWKFFLRCCELGEDL